MVTLQWYRDKTTVHEEVAIGFSADNVNKGPQNQQKMPWPHFFFWDNDSIDDYHPKKQTVNAENYANL